jgi:hypothetical protein
MFLCNDVIHLEGYTVSQPRRPQSEQSLLRKLQNLYSSLSNLTFTQQATVPSVTDRTLLQLKWVFLHAAMHRVVSSSSTKDDK